MSRFQFSRMYFSFGTDAAVTIAETKGISKAQIELWLTSIWKPAYWV